MYMYDCIIKLSWHCNLYNMGAWCVYGCMVCIWVHCVYMGALCVYGCIVCIWVHGVYMGAWCVYRYGFPNFNFAKMSFIYL